MDELFLSCHDALQYPKNLARPSIHEFTQDAFYDRLNSLESRLFHPETKALVEFLEFADGGSGGFRIDFRYRES